MYDSLYIYIYISLSLSSHSLTEGADAAMGTNTNELTTRFGIHTNADALVSAVYRKGSTPPPPPPSYPTPHPHPTA